MEWIASLAKNRTVSRLLGTAFLLAAIAFGSFVRIDTALNDPNFLTDRPEGVMRSDPGLIFYILERVIEGNGLPPADFRADPRVEHPLRTDLPALDSVSQEFPIAWARLLLGQGVPLHVFALWFMGIFASLTAVGVYLLTLELAGRVRWACLATALYAVLPANYRTIGFVLIREDFSLPFFALHLALLARAARVRTTSSMAWCALPLAAALASWHAMGFVVSLEAACLFLWYLRTGENPFDVPRAWIVPAVAAAASLAVPVLWRTGFLLAPSMRMAAGLLVAAGFRKRGAGRLSAGAAAVATVLALTGFQAAVAKAADYSHVWELLSAKIRYLGTLPADPGALSFEARYMWQGPFATLSGLETWNKVFGAGLWLFLAVLAGSARGLRTLRTPELLAACFAAVAVAATWLVSRVMPVPGILIPVCTACLLGRIRRQDVAAGVMGAALLWQGVAFGRLMADLRIEWYQPPFVTTNYRTLLSALPALVPENEAVTADPVLSTAILAHTRRPIVLQPKGEEAEARRRTKDFLLAFYQGSPDALRRLLLEKFRSRYLVVDSWMLWMNMRYMGGIALDDPRVAPGTAASAFLGLDGGVPPPVPGYRLLADVPYTFSRQGAWTVAGGMRLYELVDVSRTGGTGEGRPGPRTRPANGSSSPPSNRARSR